MNAHDSEFMPVGKKRKNKVEAKPKQKGEDSNVWIERLASRARERGPLATATWQAETERSSAPASDDVHRALVSSKKIRYGLVGLAAVVCALNPLTSVGARDFRAELTATYKQHDPSKLGGVDFLLDKYSGKEDELLAAIRTKYGVKEGGAAAESAADATQPSHAAGAAGAAIASNVNMADDGCTSAGMWPPCDLRLPRRTAAVLLVLLLSWHVWSRVREFIRLGAMAMLEAAEFSSFDARAEARRLCERAAQMAETLRESRHREPQSDSLCDQQGASTPAAARASRQLTSELREIEDNARSTHRALKQAVNKLETRLAQESGQAQVGAWGTKLQANPTKNKQNHKVDGLPCVGWSSFRRFLSLFRRVPRVA